MTLASLKLFRRHEKTCTEGYEKDFRVYAWMLEKQKGKKATVDCSCTIYAEGTLVRGVTKTYIRPKSTDKRTWTDAETVKANWLQWGDTKPPAEYAPDEAEAGTLVKIQDAVDSFLSAKTNQKRNAQIQQNRYDDVDHFLTNRFIPFASRYTYINEMDSEKIWADFMASWKNLTDPAKPLAASTMRLLTANTREFLALCVRREWLSDNWLSKEYGVTTTFITNQKEPLNEQELSYIYQAAKELTPGIGKHFHNAEQRAKELQIFIWTLRYTGLRISDVAALEISQLRTFKHGPYTHAIHCDPRKTDRSRSENFVHIPIPSTNFPNHPNLAKALSELKPKQDRYFFNTGTIDSTIQVYRAQIARVIARAEQLMDADRLPKRNGTHFASQSKTPKPPTPHSFRHSFAATLLQGGASLRLVAQYLGDTEKTVRSHYSKFCVLEQEMSAERLGDAMARYDAQTSASKKSRLRRIK